MRISDWSSDVCSSDLIFPIHISVGEFGTGSDVGFTAIIRDISDRRDVELRAEFASRNDPLTGILNRSSFIAETERMLGAQHRLDGGLWVLFNLDMDGLDRKSVV